MLIFHEGHGYDGCIDYAHPQGWHWERYGGTYFNHRDFFWVHWEIHDHRPLEVRLHVESPRAAIDSELNATKVALVEELQSPHLATAPSRRESSQAWFTVWLERRRTRSSTSSRRNWTGSFSSRSCSVPRS